MNAGISATEEKDLIERVKRDKQAFLEIYDAHFQRIYNYAYQRTMNQDDAEEITSQTFLAALEKIQSFEYRNIPLAVWLYKIASHALVDLYRKRGRSVELAEEFLPEGAAAYEPERVVVGRSEKEQLARQLKHLPHMQQQALVLRYNQNLSYKEIAQVMDKTEGAVKQLLHRGLTGLRERMVHYA
jgi:RNA polymerase sigma-70 factor (ECF subfamily)